MVFKRCLLVSLYAFNALVQKEKSMSFRVRITLAGVFLIAMIFAVAYVGSILHFDNNTLLIIALVGTGLAALFAYGKFVGE